MADEETAETIAERTAVKCAIASGGTLGIAILGVPVGERLAIRAFYPHKGTPSCRELLAGLKGAEFVALAVILRDKVVASLVYHVNGPTVAHLWDMGEAVTAERAPRDVFAPEVFER